jgi:hypothetical protein
MCPFCRRKPTVKTLVRYNRPAATLGGLQQAMDDRRFFYAWCLDCGFAKQAYERVCCEGDRLPAVEGFRCADCTRLAAVRVENQPDRRNQVNVERLGLITACPGCGVMVEKVKRSSVVGFAAND